MPHGNLTRWIEDAEARDFSRVILSEQNWRITEVQSVHLGAAIARIGHQALDYVRRPLSHLRH